MYDKIKTLFEDFVIALETDSSDRLKTILAENAMIDFSTVGRHQGVDNIVSALKWQGKPHDNYTIRITNFSVHEKDQQFFQSAYIQALVSYEAKGFMHAFLYGGHFANNIVVENGRPLFKSLRFDLDYVDGNTSFVENWWNLIQYEYFEGQKLRSCVIGEYDSPWRLGDAVLRGDENNIKDTFYHYAFALDTGDFDDLRTTYTNDVSASMPHGVFSGERDFTAYFKYVRLKEPTFSHAVVFQSLNIEKNVAHAVLLRTEPNRRGTRFLHKGNRDCVFFSASYQEVFVKKNNKWFIQKVVYQQNQLTIPVPKQIHYLDDMNY